MFETKSKSIENQVKKKREKGEGKKVKTVTDIAFFFPEFHYLLMQG